MVWLSAPAALLLSWRCRWWGCRRSRSVRGPRQGTLLWWAPLVSLVALSEELLLRGALFSAVRSEHGDIVAVAATSVLFAVIHLPLYGVGAMPIDVCAGVFLGSLRVVSGGVAAPAVAHVIADLATGWIG